jgi:hypothetical protein
MFLDKGGFFFAKICLFQKNVVLLPALLAVLYTI